MDDVVQVENGQIHAEALWSLPSKPVGFICPAGMRKLLLLCPAGMRKLLPLCRTTTWSVPYYTTGDEVAQSLFCRLWSFSERYRLMLSVSPLFHTSKGIKPARVSLMSLPSSSIQIMYSSHCPLNSSSNVSGWISHTNLILVWNSCNLPHTHRCVWPRLLLLLSFQFSDGVYLKPAACRKVFAASLSLFHVCWGSTAPC